MTRHRAMLSMGVLLVAFACADAPNGPWIGKWTGQADEWGIRKTEVELTITASGQVTWSFFRRDAKPPVRETYWGNLKQTRDGFMFDYTGVGHSSLAPQYGGGAIAAETGEWYFGELKVRNGVLSGWAALNQARPTGKKDKVAFSLRQPKPAANKPATGSTGKRKP